MKLKGDLNTVGLAELLETLGSQQASGTLSLKSPMGAKQIVFSRGQIAVLSDPLASPMLLGDLLIAQNRVTREQIDEALKSQGQAEPRPRLGEILLKMGVLTKDSLLEAVRFQVQEEILDLFTWRDATFEFDSRRTVETLGSGQFAIGMQGQVHQLAMPPGPVIQQALERQDEWRIITARLPSPHLCFWIMEKGHAALPSLPAPEQRIFRLLQEGRTIDTVVKISCLGRYTANKTIIRFLDQGWIIPVPIGELRGLATEHCMRGRYADALNIYRRLQAGAQEEDERREIERLMDVTVRAIRRARASGMHPEGVEYLGHKAAALTHQRRRLVRYAVLAAIGLVLFTATVVWVVFQHRGPPPAEYVHKVEATDKLVALHRYEEAIQIWQTFHNSLPDKESWTARLCRDKLKSTRRKQQDYIEFVFAQAQALERHGEVEKAEAAYKTFLGSFPANPHQDEATKALAGFAQRRVAKTVEQTAEALKQKLAQVRGLEDARHYQQARDEYAALAAQLPAGSPGRDKADDGLTRLQEIATQAKESYDTGLQRLQERKGEQAIEHLDAAATVWPELAWVPQAREEASRLRQRRAALHDGLASAQLAQGRGDDAEALTILGRLEKEYPEFEETRGLKERVAKSAGELKAAEALLAQAREAEKAGQFAAAREAFGQLLATRRPWLAARRILLPAHLASSPPGVTVSVNGQERGRTPLVLELPADEALVLRFTLAGYSPVERNIDRLAADDLDIKVRLGRSALQELRVAGPVCAPPALIEGRLYASAGAGLTAWDAAQGQKVWATPSLVDPKDPPPGLPPGPPEGWQNLREAPVWLGGQRLALLTPALDVLEVQMETGAATPLLKLPARARGPLAVFRDFPVAGRALLICVTYDGKVRGYDAESPKKPRWEGALDPNGLPGAEPIAGLIPGGPATVITACRNGRICGWSALDGQPRWRLDLGVALEGSGLCCPAGPNEPEPLGTFITGQGGLIAVDLQSGNKAWGWVTNQPRDRVVAASSCGSGVYVFSREGGLRRFGRAASGDGPARPLWEKTLEDAGPPPLASGGKVFVATFAGHLHALSDVDGRELWRFQCPGRPTWLALFGAQLWVATEQGHLILLRTD